LMIANEDGSGERQLAVRKWPNGFEGSVAWSPDGKAIATAVDNTDTRGKYASLVEVPVQGGTEHPVTSKHWNWIVDLVWAPDGRGLIVNTAERDSGPLQIEYVSYANGEVRRITGDPNYYHSVSVTANSRVIATMQFEFSFDAWVAPMAALDNAKPITSHGRGDEPTWSPHGKIVHWSYDDGNIWLIGSDGSNPRQLTSNSGFNANPRFSPDGRYIVFYSDRTGNGQIWRMDNQGDNLKQLTYNKFDGLIGDFSPDGRWVVYSNQGAEKGIWKIPIEGGNPIRLKGVEAADPAVSPDGKMIAYLYKDPSAYPPERFANPPRGVAIMAFAGSAPTRIFQIPNLSSFRWVADGHSLLYAKNEGGVDNFWSQPIAGGMPKQMTHFNDQKIENFDVSRDGKQLVMSRGTLRQDVVLIRDLR
jgi:Tol biopolymer transport system component